MTARPSDLEYPRRIVVDDTDPRVAYDSGTWNFDASTFDVFGILGDPYNRTMRGTNSEKAGFTFSFEGDFIQIKGAKDNRKISRPSDSILDSVDSLPKYTCQVDGSSIQTVGYFPYMFAITNNVLCEASRLSKGPHTLTMNITLDNPNSQMFWLDSIEYAYLEGADLSQQVVKVDASDPVSCTYHNDTGAWKVDPSGLYYNGTRETGATMNFRFNGSSVSLYGFNAGSERDWGRASGRYYIDNAGDTTFDIPGSKPLLFNDQQNRSNWYNQHLFTSNKVAGRKEHEMVVAYTGVSTESSPAQWLLIDYFYVTGAGASRSPEGPADGAGGGNSEGSGNSSGGGGGNNRGSDSSGGGKTPVGTIAGGVVGGVVALLGIAGFVWLLMRRRRRSRDGPRELYPREGFDPFMHGASGGHAQQYHDHPQADSGATSILGDSSTSQSQAQNFSDMKRAQREVVSAQTRQHRDSGARYNQAGPSQVVDVPPSYTAD